MSRFSACAAGVVALMSIATAQAADPTLPPAGRATPDASTPAAAPLRLQAILRGPLQTRAVINGQSVKAGDRLGEIRILAVQAHAVIVDNQGQRQTLRLSPPLYQTSRTQP
ncbi:Type II secretory pathway component [Pseudomonas sp.]|uniref:Type II secretory pathway component n=1 Tax=Pseudomonas sp. TaxID=306 RepID=UPI0028A6C7F8|nr:Type II secretory pathway component [Pseudomonas sp.]